VIRNISNDQFIESHDQFIESHDDPIGLYEKIQRI